MPNTLAAATAHYGPRTITLETARTEILTTLPYSAAAKSELATLRQAVRDALAAEEEAARTDPAWDMFGPTYQAWERAEEAYGLQAAVYGVCSHPTCGHPQIAGRRVLPWPCRREHVDYVSTV